MPDLFDFIQLLSAILGEGGLCKACRYADPQSASCQFDHRPAFVCRCLVEPLCDKIVNIMLWTGFDCCNEISHTRQSVWRLLVCIFWPDEGDGFGHVPDIVIGHGKKVRIDTPGNKGAQPAGFQIFQCQVASDGGERISPVRIGRLAEIARHGIYLGIARRCQDQRFQKGGKAFHSRLSSSRP